MGLPAPRRSLHVSRRPRGARRPCCLPPSVFYPVSSLAAHRQRPPPPRPKSDPTAGFPEKTLLKVTLDLDSRVWKGAPSPAIQSTPGAWSSQGPEGLGEAAGEMKKAMP